QEMGSYEYTVRGWVDQFATWWRGMQRKVEAGVDTAVDRLIGAELIEAAAKRAPGEDAEQLLAQAELLRTPGATTAWSEDFPELGTMADFEQLVVAAGRFGLEIALDFAIQASPDHPWVTEHPEWFRARPDGTLQYAENPPKRYQDIYPLDFESEDWQGLWEALKAVVEHWIGHGVKIFRVDNPHTKTFAFWEWLISGVKAEHPDVLFLAEAFTRPKVMYRLAKVGFTQSYTYFTWRTTKAELIEYVTELTTTELKEFFRPHFWPNTSDILAQQLQGGVGRPAFIARLIL